MNKTKKILYILAFAIAFLLIGTVESKAGSQKLNNLDFEAKINSDGSMNVTETWDIYIRETNTLYKTFKTDSSKYTGIKNVTVREKTDNKLVNFSDNKSWAYHVKKDYYYGTKNSDGDFEIGWGVGLDNSSDTRVYEISYTIEDAITKYNDYAELYWQFIGSGFEIPATSVTGTIYLPSNVDNKESIKVWGHTEDLNGTIYATDLNKIEFKIDNFRSGRYVEIRTLFPTELITETGRIKNNEILQSVIDEETKWANEANEKRERKQEEEKRVKGVLVSTCLIINLILIIIFGKKLIKYVKYLKTLNTYKPTTELKYYRELPDENTTPGEVIKITNINILEFTPNNFGKIFSATMLDLALNGYIKIEQEDNKKGKKYIKIFILKEPDEKLKSDEKCVLNFLKNVIKDKDNISLKELEKYIKEHYSKVSSLLENSYSEVNSQLISDGIIDREKQKEYKKYKNSQLKYITSLFSLLMCTFIAFIIPAIIFVINAILCGKIAKKLNILTQKGVDKKEQWNGLKKYMEDFSRLDKREIPELVIWEKYLVYATVFGIANKVIKQLKMVYPNFDETMSTNLSTYTYMNLMINTNFSKSFSDAMTSSMSSSYSSGTGSGGGFSGGGGFGRRPEAAVAGR